MASIDKRFLDFIRSKKNNIVLDDIKEDFKQNDGTNSKMADYLLFNREIILEQKLLTNDRTDLINEKLNELAKTDEWLKKCWFGSVHIEELIQKHPDSDDFRKKIMDYSYRNIKDLVATANRQIRSTKQSLNIPNAVGGLVILNEAIMPYESENVMTELNFLVENPHYEHVDFVLYISEIRRTTHNMIDMSAMIKSGSARYEFVNWYIRNVFSFDFSSFFNHPIQFL
ncbi:hypothetical protein [Citrobacter amalonaticus]|uniref:hypothetical protein n=1 Tax=Citrobacter amalonaticus TaxID=35703 RepID=UPI0021AD0921|nr:hypothetical protein [Citrobacter amalonaticus]